MSERHDKSNNMNPTFETIAHRHRIGPPRWGFGSFWGPPPNDVAARPYANNVAPRDVDTRTKSTNDNDIVERCARSRPTSNNRRRQFRIDTGPKTAPNKHRQTPNTNEREQSPRTTNDPPPTRTVPENSETPNGVVRCQPRPSAWVRDPTPQNITPTGWPEIRGRRTKINHHE